jgi:lisH domain-containing protein FOPNL
MNDDLKTAVRTALESKGVIHDMKAKIRAEIYHTVEDKSVTTPERPAEVYLASELIKEFLNLFHLNNTSSVFHEEFCQSMDMSIDRQFIANELGFNLPAYDNKEIPLLVILVQYLQQIRRRKQVVSTVTEADV